MERISDQLQISVKQQFLRDAQKSDGLKIRDIEYLKKVIEQGGIVCSKLENFLATGNLIS